MIITKQNKLRFNKLISLLVFATMATGCIDCKTCNHELSQEAVDWLPYDANEQLYFTPNNDTALAKFFVLGEEELRADEEICGNTAQPCTAEKGLKIYETDSLQSYLDYAGDIYIFTTDDGYFTGVLNILDQQLFQDDMDSSLNVGTSGEVIFHDSIEVNEKWYKAVYEAQLDSSSTDTIENLIRLYYQIENGLLQIDNQGGVSWQLSE